MTTAANAPAWITGTCDALRTAGWADVLAAAELTGRPLGEIARLWDGEEIRVLTFTWWADGMPRCKYMVRLAEVEAAPRRLPLHLV